MPGRSKYAKLFAVARTLGIHTHELRVIAAGWTGKESLRSLNTEQLHALEDILQQRADKKHAEHRQQITSDFQPHASVRNDQLRFAIDLIAQIFPDIHKFRTWLQHNFCIQHERFADSYLMKKIVAALKDMRNRGYRVR